MSYSQRVSFSTCSSSYFPPHSTSQPSSAVEGSYASLVSGSTKKTQSVFGRLRSRNTSACVNENVTAVDMLNLSEALGQLSAQRPQKSSCSEKKVDRGNLPPKTAEGTVNEQEPSIAQSATQCIQSEQFEKQILSYNLPEISEAVKKEAAKKLASWATTKADKKVGEVLSGIKPRKPKNPKTALMELTNQGIVQKTKDASVEPYIVKFRIRNNERIVSVEFPRAVGGSKTVRHLIQYNIEKKSFEYTIYSRAGKWFRFPFEKEEIVAELQKELVISSWLKQRGIGLPLKPMYSTTGRLQGFTSPPTESSADDLVNVPLPPGKTKFDGEELATRLYVMRGLLNFLSILHNDFKLVHQDIKPANLLKGHRELSGRPFGIPIDYATISEINSKTLAEGSPLYLPPEKREKVVPETDCYAAGITLKQLVRGQNAKISLDNVLEDLDPSEPIDALIRGLCNPSPANRMTAQQAHDMVILILQDIQHEQRLTMCTLFSHELPKNE